MIRRGILILLLSLVATRVFAQAADTGQVRGKVTDETGGVLPGVTVELGLLSAGAGMRLMEVTSTSGEYAFEGLGPGRYQLSFTLINFGSVIHRDIDVTSGVTRVDTVMHLSLNAEVTVTGKATFANLADVENPAENLVGIAQSASQGAITSQQLDVRPIMRAGEILETVPGVIVSSHAGGGKANQYFLRGFNLDHGTDFAQTLVGMPVNMPSHAHGQGYSDINFLIPELVSGVQFSKGPYFADQGDFATAGSSNINYATSLDRPIVTITGGNEGYGRALFAASPAVSSGHLLGALEVEHSDGPFVVRDAYQKISGVVRYSRGDSVNGWALTGMGYHGKWNSTDQVAQRAVESGLIDRFGTLDRSDGGNTYRYSGSFDWQQGRGNQLTKITAYGIGYNLDLFSNFTYYLDDDVNGDQIEQADHRFISGLRVVHKRQATWGGHAVQNTFGVQLRNDNITNLGLYHTLDRVRLDTRSQASVVETLAGAHAQNEVELAPWLRSMVGLRVDGVRFGVTDQLKAFGNDNGGVATAGMVSPKGGVTLGPWAGTEFYLNAGMGFHSNDARGTTATLDADGNPTEKTTPLVRARGGEVGFRTVVIPHLQTTLTVWTLRIDSELAFSGDTAGSEPSRPSTRHGLEFANYYSPYKWLIFDGDVSWSHARYSESDPVVGDFIPEAVETVISAGASIDNLRRTFASLRWRYFGPRPLIEDNSARSQPTSLVNFELGYRLARKLRVNLEVFNLLNAADDDVTYYYESRLPGEPPEGVADFVSHPTIPRSARISFAVGF